MVQLPANANKGRSITFFSTVPPSCVVWWFTYTVVFSAKWGALKIWKLRLPEGAGEGV